MILFFSLKNKMIKYLNPGCLEPKQYHAIKNKMCSSVDIPMNASFFTLKTHLLSVNLLWTFIGTDTSCLAKIYPSGSEKRKLKIGKYTGTVNKRQNK